MKKHRKSTVPPDDAELFRISVSDVTPLPRPQKAELDRPRPRPLPAQRIRDDRQALQDSLSDTLPWEAGIESGEELSFARHGVSPLTLRKLRRGHWHIQDELDLHGLSVDEARGWLGDFLHRCARRGLRCVRIIHGKGLGSKNREPVLKRKVAVWLIQRDEILAFCQARRADGGSGAVVVLLKDVSR